MTPIRTGTCKQWYVVGCDLGRVKDYMMCLLRSRELFDTDVQELHQFELVSYYKKILCGESDGTVNIGKGGRKRMILDLDAPAEEQADDLLQLPDRAQPATEKGLPV